MKMDLEGKTALVTGSISGIGYAIADQFAQAGAKIMLHGLGDLSQHQTLADKMVEAYGVELAFSNADLSTPEGVYQLVDDTKARFGGIDILVNNAGIQHISPVQDFPDDKWQAVMNINLSACFYATKAVLPMMQAGGWGRIINIASVHGVVASINKAAYVAAKHGLVGLTRAVALETADSPVTCNAICPAWTLTELIEPQIAARAKAINASSCEEAIRDLVGEKQPSKTPVNPSDLAALALFLCQDAASQITGATLPVDGGWTAQ